MFFYLAACLAMHEFPFAIFLSGKLSITFQIKNYTISLATHFTNPLAAEAILS